MAGNQIDQNGDGTRVRYPCNDFELAGLIGGVCIHPGGGSGAAAWRLQTPGGGDQKFRTFAEAAAAGGGGDWFKVNGRLRGWSGAWFPAAAVERAKQIGNGPRPTGNAASRCSRRFGRCSPSSVSTPTPWWSVKRGTGWGCCSRRRWRSCSRRRPLSWRRSREVTGDGEGFLRILPEPSCNACGGVVD